VDWRTYKGVRNQLMTEADADQIAAARFMQSHNKAAQPDYPRVRLTVRIVP
jgi:hypothetical protein